MSQAIWKFKVRDYSTELVGRRDSSGFYVERGDGTRYHYDNDRIVESRLVTQAPAELEPRHVDIISRAAGMFHSLTRDVTKMTAISEELLSILEPEMEPITITMHINPNLCIPLPTGLTDIIKDHPLKVADLVKVHPGCTVGKSDFTGHYLREQMASYARKMTEYTVNESWLGADGNMRVISAMVTDEQRAALSPDNKQYYSKAYRMRLFITPVDDASAERIRSIDTGVTLHRLNPIELKWLNYVPKIGDFKDVFTDGTSVWSFFDGEQWCKMSTPEHTWVRNIK